MNRLVILMYHALYADEQELSDIPPSDRPYAVSVRDFDAHLDALAEDGLPIVDPRILATREPAGPGVILTFDDGHESGYRLAFPRLAQRGHPAAFFVTTDFVDARPDFCRWAQLKEMADHRMLIGAHGRSHRFFDDLDENSAIGEFAESKAVIEEQLGREVVQMSFPGGRFTRKLVSIGMSSGYRCFHTSQVGSERPRPFEAGAILPRIPVRRAMSAGSFRLLVNARRTALMKLRAVAAAKSLARRIAGNRVYHEVYERLAN